MRLEGSPHEAEDATKISRSNTSDSWTFGDDAVLPRAANHSVLAMYGPSMLVGATQVKDSHPAETDAETEMPEVILCNTREFLAEDDDSAVPQKADSGIVAKLHKANTDIGTKAVSKATKVLRSIAPKIRNLKTLIELPQRDPNFLLEDCSGDKECLTCTGTWSPEQLVVKMDETCTHTWCIYDFNRILKKAVKYETNWPPRCCAYGTMSWRFINQNSSKIFPHLLTRYRERDRQERGDDKVYKLCGDESCEAVIVVSVPSAGPSTLFRCMWCGEAGPHSRNSQKSRGFIQSKLERYLGLLSSRGTVSSNVQDENTRINDGRRGGIEISNRDTPELVELSTLQERELLPSEITAGMEDWSIMLLTLTVSKGERRSGKDKGKGRSYC